jgi:hypothetical protein
MQSFSNSLLITFLFPLQSHGGEMLQEDKLKLKMAPRSAILDLDVLFLYYTFGCHLLVASYSVVGLGSLQTLIFSIVQP